MFLLKNVNIKKIILFMLIFVLFVNIMDSVVFADGISDAKKKKKKAEEEYEEAQASIDDLAAEQAGVEEEIAEVNDALVQIIAELDIVENQLKEKQEQIDETVLLYNEAVETEKKQYEAMKIRIKFLYEHGETDILSLYMESEGNITDSLTKSEYVEKLYEYDRNMLATYQETVKQVDELHTRLLGEQEELELLEADYEAQQSELETVMTELQAVADDYNVQIREAKNRAAVYAKEIEKQTKEIARLEEEERKRKEEERKRKEEEARKKAAAQMQTAEDTGVVKTTNNVTYDVSSIYSASGSDLGKSVASYACQFIGNPYVAGGTSLTNGADCSGFVYSVYKNFGYKVPRTSYSLRSAGTEVSYADAQPGDVICYAGHVAIYIGNGMIVHASTEKTGIKVSNAGYRSILSVRRIL